MTNASPLFASALDAVQFIDHRNLAWSNIRQTDYWLHKRITYTYPGPVRELRQRLLVVPPDQYGDQHLRDYAVRVLGAHGNETRSFDRFGNRVISFEIAEVPFDITFEVALKIERAGYPNLLPTLSPTSATPFLTETPLTASNQHINAVAHELAARHATPIALADAINTWVWQSMRYGWGVTTINTTAAEALAFGQGLCQDYTHIMLAICRAAGLSARYVSGHLLGEGGSHAWVEVLLPTDNGDLVATPFDPTNHRRANLSYITIAVGRDYHDVSPTSGSFIAPYPGHLTTSKRAGLTHNEYATA